MIRPCPVCGSIWPEKIKLIRMILPQSIPLPEQYEIVSCKQCGFCYANTSAEQINYDVYYSMYNTYSGAEDKAQLNVFEPIRNFMEEHISKSDRILDIGFGNGGLLLHLRELGYANLTGLDPSQHSVDRLREQGIEAYRKSIHDESGELTGCFDVVFLTYVLEHLLNPKEAIIHAGDYLKNGGYLIINIPDYAQCSKVDLPIPNQFNQEHINYFSESSFLTLISATDFQMVYSKSLEFKTTDDRGSEYSKMFVLQKSVQDGRVMSIQKDLETKGSIESYLSRQESRYKKTADIIDELRAKQTPLLIWGSGALTMSLLASTQLQKCNIVAFVDSNPLKVGTVICNRTVIAPDAIQHYPEAVIAICAMKFAEEIRNIIVRREFPNPVIILGGTPEN